MMSISYSTIFNTCHDSKSFKVKIYYFLKKKIKIAVLIHLFFKIYMLIARNYR